MGDTQLSKKCQKAFYIQVFRLLLRHFNRLIQENKTFLGVDSLVCSEYFLCNSRTG